MKSGAGCTQPAAEAGDDAWRFTDARAGDPKRADGFIQMTSFQTSSERCKFKLGASEVGEGPRASGRASRIHHTRTAITSRLTQRAAVCR